MVSGSVFNFGRRLLSLVRKPDGQRQRQQTNLPLQVATTTTTTTTSTSTDSTDTTGSAVINKNRLLL